MTSAIRLRTADRAPTIRRSIGYDQDEFARRLHYDRPIEASLEAFKGARRSTAELLDCLTEAEWQREGTHTEHGRYDVARWLEIYAAHAHQHADQISRAARGSRAAGEAATQRLGTEPRDLAISSIAGIGSPADSSSELRERRTARFPRARDVFRRSPASICSRSSDDPARMSNGSFSCSYS